MNKTGEMDRTAPIMDRRDELTRLADGDRVPDDFRGHLAPAYRAGWNDRHDIAAQGAKPGGVVAGWRCFHCCEEFTDSDAAALHFGTHQYQDPACLIDIAKYREMEARQQSYAAEDADVHRAMYRQQSEHQLAVQRAEESGYAKGLADAAKHPADVIPPAVLTSAERDVIEMLLVLAYKAWCLADDTEDAGGEKLNVERSGFDELSEALDKIEQLPDDQPGYTMGEAAKARWALRRVLESQQPAADDTIAAARWRFVSDKAWFVDAATRAFDLSSGWFDERGKLIDEDDTTAAVDSAIAKAATPAG